MTIYKEEECPDTWFTPVKVYCCICGKYTGLVCTYPGALNIFNLAEHVCRIGYGCKQKCNCSYSMPEKKPFGSSYTANIREDVFRCIKCKKILNK